MRVRKNKDSDENITSLLSTIDRPAGAPDQEFLKELRERSAREFTAGAPNVSANTPKSIPIIALGGMIMKSPLTRLALAAAVVVAGAIGVSLWQQTGSGLALADVVARMEQVQTFRLKMSTTFQTEGGPAMPVAQGTLLVSRTLGQKTVMELKNPLTGQSMLEEIYGLPQERTIITLMPNEKQYSKVDLDDAALAQWQRESDPRRMVEQIQKCVHTSLGRSVVDGIEVEGFRTTDPNYWGGTPVAGAEVTVWANVETRLPVRIEAGKDAPGKGQVQVAAYDFEWDVPLEAAGFAPVIPADYTPGRPMMQIGLKK